LDFLEGWRSPSGCAAGADLLVFSLSIALSLIEFLLDRVAVVTWITQLGRNIKLNLRAIERARRMSEYHLMTEAGLGMSLATIN